MAKKQEGNFRKLLTVGDLLRKHEKYLDNVSEWEMLLAVYEGIKQIISKNYIQQHEREPDDAYKRRMDELYGLGYSKSVVDIFHFYLFKKEPDRSLAVLQRDQLWELFFEDANLYGDSFDTTVMDISLYASILGHMGVLVDKPNTAELNKRQQIDNRVYPYIARYFPSAILDWEMGKDDYGKPILLMVKLLDDNGQYRIWTREVWEVWERPTDTQGDPETNEEVEAVFIEGGINELGVVPFLWHYNQKSKELAVGISDIAEISRIDLSIIRNLSQIEEVINYAAFPMMLRPKMAADPKKMNVSQAEDEVGVQAVQEFDPEFPTAVPKWMETEVADPIRAIIDFIEIKITEIYRSSNAGGSSTTSDTQVKSGVALQTEFQLLNSKLVSKAIQLEKTERRIVNLWLKWEEKEKYISSIRIARDRQFDIDNLSADLENAVVAKTVVLSQTFNQLLQKRVARTALPTTSEYDMAQIDKEVEDNTKKATQIIQDNIPNNVDNNLNGVQNRSNTSSTNNRANNNRANNNRVQNQ